MSIPLRFMSKIAATAYGALLGLVAFPANAALSLSNTPLFLTVTMPPNITLTLDDSGSMSRAWVPEICPGTGDIRDCSVLDHRYAKSSAYNQLYYNPNVKYPLPKKANGTDWTTSFTAAYRNGFDTGFSSTQDLRTGYRPSASLFLEPGQTPSEEYMGHYASDVRCSNDAANMCQIKNAAGTWVSGASNCSGNNNTARNASCAAAQGSGYTVPRMPAYYYVFDKDLAACASDSVTDDACYSIRLVTTTSGPGTIDLNGDGVINATDKNERQNFANWYSFARTRNLSTVTAASVAFSDLDGSARVAWQALNTCRGGNDTLVTADCDGWKQNTTNVSNSIGTYGVGTQKSDFYTWLAQLPTNSGTPLPDAMNRVGKYYQTTGENSPYDNDYSAGSSGQHACRRNYHIMMTDGIWNNGISNFNNYDNANHTLPDPTTDLKPNITDYFARAPYKDTYSNTLADVAFYYWINDLTNLKNILAPVYNDRAGDTDAIRFWNAKNDPATWQHMVNFTIGLGLSGYLKAPSVNLTWEGDTYTGSFPALAAGTVQWPNANSTDQNPANVADLWHAAINSRGQFFSADDPASLSASFAAALTAITGSNGSSAALSANSTSVRPGETFVYQAKFNRDWSGTLLALPVDQDGRVLQKTWDAGEVIPDFKTRRIFTRGDSGGVEFLKCEDLSTEQRDRLDRNASGIVDGRCQKRLDWLRGDTTNEQRFTGGVLRNRPPSEDNPKRTKLMGDIINSDPAYVEDMGVGYENLPSGTPGQDTYADFVKSTAVASRPAMVYVGANDGMLHGILAADGVEQFAYIPSGVNATLARLTDPNYTHRYYVDGGVTAGDAFVNDTWKTLVLGGLNAGGKTVYALDVTDPTTFGASNLMWEFSDTDMGLSYSQPQIGVTESGDWIAAFGNGYNSPNGTAVLYLVDLYKGLATRKFTVGPTALGDNNNGLSTPLLVDSDGNQRIDAIYAGDLQGNMWKFDLSGKTSGDWTVALGNLPLFTASILGVRQPITSQPKTAGHPDGGQMVLFGTGKYLSMSDVSDKSLQSYYGIRDFKDVAAGTRVNLQAQSIDLQQTESGQLIRTISSNVPDWSTMRGWYLDLQDPPSTKNGERVISTSLVKFDRAIFVTVIPSTDPCVPGGTSWLMELDIVNGGTFADSILDVNNDGEIDDDDKANSGDDNEDNDKTVSGVLLETLGISKTPVWLDCQSGGCKVLTGTSGSFDTKLNKKPEDEDEDDEVPPVQRRSWIQIR
jgi:type IV pilus assembly protein PilY1